MKTRSKLVALLVVAKCVTGSEAAARAEEYLSPTALAATRDGQTLFVACAMANKVLVFNAASGQILKSLPLPDSPSGLALAPDESRLYVTCAAPESRVCVLGVA